MVVLMSLGATALRQSPQLVRLSFSFQPTPVPPQGTAPLNLETPGMRRVIRSCLDGVRMNRPVPRLKLGEHTRVA